MMAISTADLLICAVAVLLGVQMIRVDLREHRLPNRLTGAAALLVVLIAALDAVVRADAGRLLPMAVTAAAMAGAGYLLAAAAPTALGLGDVKLLGVIGFALGHLEVSTVVLWLLALALSSAGWLLLGARFDRGADRAIPWRKRHVAFGPPMITAWWLVYLALAIGAAVGR